MDRRSFLAAVGSVPVSAWAGSLPLRADEPTKRLRVAVIGHTGHGNYGHGLDTVWLSLPETEIVAVADSDAAGLAAAKQRLHAADGFRDYREMLSAVKPDITAVCPRFVDEHADMVLAAVEAGSRGIYIEKPLCRTPAEGDRLIAACERRGTKLAVGHRNRYRPELPAIDKLIADGAIGRVLEIRGRGKGDRRGGGEDLWVLGPHVLNLIAYFAGPPKSCSAVVLQDGRRVTKADVREGSEGIGPLVGNEVHARFETERGITAYFDSIADDGTKNAGFGLQIIGSDGVIDLKCDQDPFARLIRGNPFRPPVEPRVWQTISSAGAGVPEPIANVATDVGHHVTGCRDLIACLTSDRQPLCNVRDGVRTIEMILSVFESHRRGGAAVEFPLVERGNPLAKL
jgi:predicted dehydrogenase